MASLMIWSRSPMENYHRIHWFNCWEWQIRIKWDKWSLLFISKSINAAQKMFKRLFQVHYPLLFLTLLILSCRRNSCINDFYFQIRCVTFPIYRRIFFVLCSRGIRETTERSSKASRISFQIPGEPPDPHIENDSNTIELVGSLNRIHQSIDTNCSGSFESSSFFLECQRGISSEASRRCLTMSKALYSMSPHTSREDLQMSTNELLQSATNLLTVGKWRHLFLSVFLSLFVSAGQRTFTRTNTSASVRFGRWRSSSSRSIGQSSVETNNGSVRSPHSTLDNSFQSQSIGHLNSSPVFLTGKTVKIDSLIDKEIRSGNKAQLRSLLFIELEWSFFSLVNCRTFASLRAFFIGNKSLSLSRSPCLYSMLMGKEFVWG